MAEEDVPYGDRPIGRIGPGPGETDAQALDTRRSGPGSGSDADTDHDIPPVESAPFEIPHIPVYCWVTGLLIVDLGRHERFRKLLRIGRARAAHLRGTPAAMFVASYAGVLLIATASPTRAHRARLFPALFTASATSSGIAAVMAALELTGGTRPGIARRLARAQVVALATELALELENARVARALPSGRREPGRTRAVRWAAIGLGMAVPLALSALESVREIRDDDRAPSPRRRSGLRLVAAGLALVGSLVMRWLTVDEGSRSARTPEDTWRYAGARRPSTNGDRPAVSGSAGSGRGKADDGG